MPKPNLLLDLDNTLICSVEYHKIDMTRKNSKILKFKYHNMKNYYLVFERPHLQTFLDWAFENFNICIWTAASKDYALFIIDKCVIAGKKNRRIEWLFFSTHCAMSMKIFKSPKNIGMLWKVFNIDIFNERNTIILDDLPVIYTSQPGNCVAALPFEFHDTYSHEDNFLFVLRRYLSLFKVRSKPAEYLNKTLGVVKTV